MENVENVYFPYDSIQPISKQDVNNHNLNYFPDGGLSS